MSDAAANAGSRPSASRKRFRRRSRLLRHADFDEVYKQGRRHFAAHITVFYLLQPAGTAFRVGFTVGKALGGAVDRNRMKRRLREAVRLHIPQTPAAVDVVINPKKSILTMEFTELCKEVARAFEVIQKFAAKSGTHAS